MEKSNSITYAIYIDSPNISGAEKRAIKLCYDLNNSGFSCKLIISKRLFAAFQAAGRSLVIDYRYPERTTYLEQLSQFYPKVLDWKSGKIIVDGANQPISAVVTSTDLRGSMALVLATIISRGKSEVNKVQMAMRGYNNMEYKLKNLGVKFQIN